MLAPRAADQMMQGDRSKPVGAHTHRPPSIPPAHDDEGEASTPLGGGAGPPLPPPPAAAAMALFRMLLPILLLLLAVHAALAVEQQPQQQPDDDAAPSSGGEVAARYPLMARLAPCLPLPVHSNCSEVPETLKHNMLQCAHVSFQPGGFGRGAKQAQLAFEVEPDVGEAEEGTGLTMVLLVGSTLWFEDQVEMWDFLQPKLSAALQASHGYDPTLQGPCMGGRQEDGEGAAIQAVARQRRGRRVRRRLLRGPEQQEQQQEEDGPDGDDGIVPAVFPGGGGLPSCADVVATFNAADGLAGAASPFAFLYTCNVTASTPRSPRPEDGSDGPAPSPQLLSYDHLRPEDYPFSYFVFINANVAPADQPDTAVVLGAPPSRAVNQTVRYAASFSPTYTPTAAKLPEPAFVLLLLACAVCFLLMSAWFSAPVLDFLSTRWLRARV